MLDIECEFGVEDHMLVGDAQIDGDFVLCSLQPAFHESSLAISGDGIRLAVAKIGLVRGQIGSVAL